MTRNRKRLFSILLSLVLMLGAVPIEGLVMVAHADEKVLSGSMNETATDGDVLTGSTSGRVTIASGAKIKLSKVTITGGIVCNGSAEITLVGTNNVTGTNDANGTGAGTDGIKINGTLTIKGDGSLTVTGGDGAKSNGAYVADGGNGIVGALVVESDSASITAIGGKGQKGGDGIRLELDPLIQYSEKAALEVTKGSPIIQATGGNATDGNGGRGISIGTEARKNCYALWIPSGSPQITSTGGNSTSGTAGDGIYGPVTITTDSDKASVLAIHGDGRVGDPYAISGATTVSAGFAAFNRMSEDAPWNIDSDINGNQTTTITSERFVIEDKYGRIFKSYCSVVLDENGGSGIVVDPMYYGLDDTMTLPDNTYVRSKYSFTGWNTKEDGSGKPYADGAAITLSAGATDLDEFRQLILYAQWEKYPDPTITRPPAAISGLVYNTKAQALVTAGEVTGGEMQYALGRDAATAPTDGWSTSVPTKTDVGTYYVWYRAKGNEGYNDSDAKCITAKIEAAPTPSGGAVDGRRETATVKESKKEHSNTAVTPTYTPSYASGTTTSYSSNSSSGGGSGSGTGYIVASGKNSKGYYGRIGKHAVEYISPKTSKKAKVAKVPSKIRIGKKTYKVTAVSPYAFTGQDSLRTVIIGRNVKRISPYAFYGCKKLKVLRVRSRSLTAKKIKNCLKGSNIHKVVVLKNAADRLGAYRNIFTKQNTGASERLSIKKQN